MKLQYIEFSWHAVFIGLYMTPERDKVWWATILPFFPLYFKRSRLNRRACRQTIPSGSSLKYTTDITR